MPDLFSYIRPFRYDRVARIAVVETGPTHLVAGVLEELRTLFPQAHVEILLREEDTALAECLAADRVRVVRHGERAELVRALRAEPFDLIVMQLSRGGSKGLRSLPFALKGRSLVAFNDSLDHFPLNVFRLRDLASHFGLAGQGVRVLLAPSLFVFLLVSTAGIRVRGLWRRAARSVRRGRPPEPATPAPTRRQGLDRSRAAAGSEGA